MKKIQVLPKEISYNSPLANEEDDGDQHEEDDGDQHEEDIWTRRGRYPKVPNLDLLDHLGTGAFGTVYKATDLQSGTQVAVKCMEREYWKMLSDEGEMLLQADHPNIVKMFRFQVLSDCAALTMEFVDGETLYDLISRSKPLSEQFAWPIMYQTVSALAYIHDQNIVHSDIKLDNLLYSTQGVIKVADFGLARCFVPGERLKGKVGTRSFMAPEILREEEYEGPPVDVWATGVVLHTLFTKKVPFSNRELQKIERPFVEFTPYHPPAMLSKSCTSLLLSMICENAAKRISMQEIVDHPWFQNFPGTPWRNNGLCNGVNESRPPKVVAEEKRVHAGVVEMEMNNENIDSIHIFSGDGIHGNPESVSLPVQEEETPKPSQEIQVQRRGTWQRLRSFFKRLKPRCLRRQGEPDE